MKPYLPYLVPKSLAIQKDHFHEVLDGVRTWEITSTYWLSNMLEILENSSSSFCNCITKAIKSTEYFYHLIIALDNHRAL